MNDVLVYKRARFGTRLPASRVYTRSHCWLLEREPGVWRVGLTAFAVRMLGDIIEYEFEAAPGSRVEAGQKIGWIEGFKSVSDIHSAAEGAFAGENALLRDDITLLESDPYERGWLYEVEGRPQPDSLDAAAYAAVLDGAIDRMLASLREENEDG
jgi:glycine cleavage system H protein